MEIQNIFYGIGIFFLFLTIIYFLSTYLEDVPSSIKSILSFLLAVILFVLGDYLRRLDK
ncbi:MAG: hypothetical protein HRU03_08180 [Nanoarchaeales archaeon]|nr:hypothetical protein [Nanoarchaeales archaeon]